MKELYRANGPTPYDQKTHPDVRYLKNVPTLTKKRKFFNGDELMEGTGEWARFGAGEGWCREASVG
jgi:hypothetical protein